MVCAQFYASVCWIGLRVCSQSTGPNKHILRSRMSWQNSPKTRLQMKRLQPRLTAEVLVWEADWISGGREQHSLHLNSSLVPFVEHLTSCVLFLCLQLLLLLMILKTKDLYTVLWTVYLPHIPPLSPPPPPPFSEARPPPPSLIGIHLSLAVGTWELTIQLPTPVTILTTAGI